MRTDHDTVRALRRERPAPNAAGSGIPQVMAALDTAVTGPEVRCFVSLRLAGAKLLLTC